jgi:hypothetical protein
VESTVADLLNVGGIADHILKTGPHIGELDINLRRLRSASRLRMGAYQTRVTPASPSHPAQQSHLKAFVSGQYLTLL